MKQLQTILQNLCSENNLETAVLTDASGFPLAASTSGGQAEAPAAVVAAIQRIAEQARSHVGLSAMDEVSMYDELGQRLVCRSFQAGQHAMYLAVKVPPQVVYRRATNQAIRQIQTIWNLKTGQK